ncbi:hypothetical protein CJ179_38335 [Rhodococcus sp. ACS1]|nr:hypothetical protein CJ179_38335 [Rhodococcus sp. ACS1]
MSKWAQLKAEAKKEYEPPKPYLFDAYDPPIEISAPDSLERSLALATLTDLRGQVAVKDMKPMIEALVGADAFPFVWAEIADEPVEVTLALVEDINDHFNEGADDSAGSLPGGE